MVYNRKRNAENVNKQRYCIKKNNYVFGVHNILYKKIYLKFLK